MHTNKQAICQLGGQSAWDELSAKGIMADGFTLHLNGVPLSLPPPEGEPVVLVDRSSIVSALKDELFANDFAEGTDVRIEYSSRVLSVDVEESLDYDLLIGSDGVRSRVREAMNSQLPPGRFDSELRVMPGRWMVLRVDLPERYSKTSVHAMVASEAPFGLFCIPDKAGPHCVIASWTHAVGGGSLGQGCSAALQDAAALAECLREGARLNQELLRSKREEQTQEGVQQWLQVREEALVGHLDESSAARLLKEAGVQMKLLKESTTICALAAALCVGRQQGCDLDNFCPHADAKTRQSRCS
eukprot:g22724.t2